jgi:hypothetical protein
MTWPAACGQPIGDLCFFGLVLPQPLPLRYHRCLLPARTLGISLLMWVKNGATLGGWCCRLLGGQNIGGPNISGHSLSQKVLLALVARFWMSHAGKTRSVLQSIIIGPLADFLNSLWGRLEAAHSVACRLADTRNHIILERYCCPDIGKVLERYCSPGIGEVW